MTTKVTKANVPPCCGNCKFNQWLEDGPHCVHPWHWDEGAFEIDSDDGALRYRGEEMTEGGVIDWDDVCEHHAAGSFSELTDSGNTLMSELIDARCIEVKAAIRADLGLPQR